MSARLTTGCAAAMVGVLVCSAAPPWVKEGTARTEVRAVRLVSLAAADTVPLGVVVGTVAGGGDASAARTVVPTVIDGAAPAPASLPSDVDSSSVTDPTQVTDLGVVDYGLGSFVANLVVQPFFWFGAILPAEIQPIYLAWFFFPFVFIPTYVVGRMVDEAIGFVLGLFGIGTFFAASAAAISPSGTALTADSAAEAESASPSGSLASDSPADDPASGDTVTASDVPRTDASTADDAVQSAEEVGGGLEPMSETTEPQAPEVPEGTTEQVPAEAAPPADADGEAMGQEAPQDSQEPESADQEIVQEPENSDEEAADAEGEEAADAEADDPSESDGRQDDSSDGDMTSGEATAGTDEPESDAGSVDRPSVVHAATDQNAGGGSPGSDDGGGSQ